MKYIKIVIKNCRDGSAFSVLQNAADSQRKAEEAHAAQDRKAAQIEILSAKSKKPNDAALARAARESAENMAADVVAASVTTELASEANTRAAQSHPLVGKFGYQEIDSATNEVKRLLDETGNPFPSDAVFGYEVADANPAFPAWGIPDAPAVAPAPAV